MPSSPGQDKPWAKLGWTRKMWDIQKPWKKAGMSKKRYTEILLALPDETVQEIQDEADAEMLLESVFDEKDLKG
jgi:hypothetical protein